MSQMARLRSLHEDISQQQELINYDTAQEGSDDQNGHPGHTKMAVQTQKNRPAGDHCNLHRPCMVPVRIDSPSNERIDLQATPVENNDRKRSIQNIQPHNQKKVEEQPLTVAVDVTASFLILCASERTPPTVYRIAAQNRGGLFPTILKGSIVHLQDPEFRIRSSTGIDLHEKKAFRAGSFR